VTGSRPDEAWEALHDASEAMLMLFSEEGLRREAPRLSRQLNHLDPGDPELRAYRKLIDELRDLSTPTTDDQRASLRDMLEEAHAASDRYQREVRGFRNKLFTASAMMGLFLLVAGVLHAINTDIFSVCATGSTGTPYQPLSRRHALSRRL